MKTIVICITAALALALNAQENKPKTDAKADKPKPTQEELEARFKATLTKATFNGRWCPLEEGKLGPEKKDRYTINSAAKVGADLWLINARMQYGGTDLVVPIPVQVKWAGDTAVIIVDKFAMPNSSSAYSARVQVYENTYAGTWSGEDNAGMLYGTITQAKE